MSFIIEYGLKKGYKPDKKLLNKIQGHRRTVKNLIQNNMEELLGLIQKEIIDISKNFEQLSDKDFITKMKEVKEYEDILERIEIGLKKNIEKRDNLLKLIRKTVKSIRNEIFK